MIALIVVFGIIIAIWAYIHFTADKLAQYQKTLHLRKANLVYGNNLAKISAIVLPARDSVYSKTEPIIWLYSDETYREDLYIGANSKGDVRIWLQPSTVLQNVHIVLDSSANNSLVSNVNKDKLPKQVINLEGNFTKNFTLYCNQGQQIIALQIIAPDILQYMQENLLTVDIEILDSQVAIISKGGANSLQGLLASIGLANKLSKVVRAATKVTSM